MPGVFTGASTLAAVVLCTPGCTCFAQKAAFPVLVPSAPAHFPHQ